MPENSTDHAPPAIVGAVNIQTGADAAGTAGNGRCAEQDAVDKLGGDPDLVLFSAAVRPRTRRALPVCREVCQPRYARDQFDEDVVFESFRTERGKRYADSATRATAEKTTGPWLPAAAAEVDDAAAAATLIAFRSELSADGTVSGSHFRYQPGHLRAYVDIADPAANLTLATIRVDLTSNWLLAGWCSPTRAELDDDLEDALGCDLLVEPADGVPRAHVPERAAGWLVAQLARPLVRLSWAGRADSWMLADTDRMLAERGDWRLSRRPDSRDEAVIVR